jgi:uncharacterized protein YbjT (DUF2867 family)
MIILIAGGTGTAGRVIAHTAAAAGHEVRILTRSGRAPAAERITAVRGDLTEGTGLDDAMPGVEAVIDASNIATPFGRRAARFFVAGSRNLLAAEARHGIPHHLVVSIVGIDTFPSGYYRAKLAQEATVIAEAGRLGVGHTIARVTQFHDFAEQVLRRYRIGRTVLVPGLHLQPVHLDDVAVHLIGLLAAGPSGRAPELGGPQPEDLLSMTQSIVDADIARGFADVDSSRLRIRRLPLGPGAWRADAAGALRPASGVAGLITFAQWLAGRAVAAG